MIYKNKARMIIFILSVLAAITVIMIFYNVDLSTELYRFDKKYVSEISFSADSGFYDSPFYLSIDAPEGEIYYTLDGTDPTMDSIKYTGPIYIEDATSNPNVYSERTDLSKFFYKDLTKFYVEHKKENGAIDIIPDYVVPDHNVDKCTIIKATTYDEKGNRGDTVSASYFVGEGLYPSDDELYTVSVISDPEGLFDYEKGIYVTGKLFDEFVNDEEGYFADPYEYEGFWDANYFEAGREWEREADIQMFRGRDHILSQQAGIRIQGGASRELYPKSLNLYARPEYDGNTVIHMYQNMGICPERVTITNGGEDVYSKMRDPLMSEVCKDMNFVTMDYKPCEKYLDGEYWGFFFLTDRYCKKFLQQK